MSKATLFVLFGLVLGLGVLWLWKEREIASGGPALEEFPLCPGLSVERVRALRIDHLEKGFQIKLERDAAGRWFMTDPVDYPAHVALVRALLQGLEGARGDPVEAGADQAELGLDPPAVVVECTQVTEGGERVLRIELGRVDLDSALVYARAPGHPRAAAGGGDVFRTTRMLVNTLERVPDDYRERRATGLAAQDVVSIRRRGQVYLAEEQQLVDLDFDSLLGPDGWKRVTRSTVSLDPTAMGLLARGAVELGVERFVDDSPQDVARYGLDPPLFSVTVEALSEKPVELRFGHPEPETRAPIGDFAWYCQRAGHAHVWEVSARDVELLTRPTELFFDQMVVRMLRTDVARLELEDAGARRVLAREGEAWSVLESIAGVAGTDGPRFPGNPVAIEEALALLERVQLGDYRGREPFAPADPPLAFTVVLKSGARLGGALGAPARDEQSGAQGLQYLRYGDEVVALIGEEVAELCRRPLDAFLSRVVHRFQESLVRALELTHAGTSFTFVNNGDNLWTPEGQRIRAPDDFVQSLDALLHLGARRWFDPGAEPAHPALLEVVLRPTTGDPVRFAFARGASGESLCLTQDGRVAEVDPAVVTRLLELF